MARKNRVTTSVSTLVSQINTMVATAAVGNRRDLLKVLVPIRKDIQKLAAEYLRIRGEIDPLYILMFPARKEIDVDKVSEEIEAELLKDSEEELEVS